MKTMLRKSTVFAVTALAGLLATAISGFAASQVRATIPFNFEAGAKKLPAGTYMIQRADNGHSITVVSLDTPDAIMVPVVNSGNISAEKSARLVFERLGDTYRLSDVKIAGGIPSDSIPRSKKQALVARQQSESIFVEVALD